jgi:hypothetical protein
VKCVLCFYIIIIIIIIIIIALLLADNHHQVTVYKASHEKATDVMVWPADEGCQWDRDVVIKERTGETPYS